MDALYILVSTALGVAGGRALVYLQSWKRENLWSGAHWAVYLATLALCLAFARLAGDAKSLGIADMSLAAGAILMVGAFASSAWLFRRARQRNGR